MQRYRKAPGKAHSNNKATAMQYGDMGQPVDRRKNLRIAPHLDLQERGFRSSIFFAGGGGAAPLRTVRCIIITDVIA